MTEYEYNQMVKSLAENVADLVEEGEDESESLHSEVDNALIYYSDQRAVIQHTDNLDAVDEMGGEIPQEAQEAIATIAFYALMQDVQDRMN